MPDWVRRPSSEVRGETPRAVTDPAPVGDRDRRGRWQPSAAVACATRLLLVGTAYYITATLSLKLALVGQNVTPVWPPTGIALAALLAFGRSVWPAISVAAFFVNTPISASPLAAAATAAGNTVAPLLAAGLLARVGFRRQLDRLIDAVALVFLGALLSMMVSATVGAGTLVLSGSIPPDAFPSTWSVWWAGDATGILVVAPFLFVLGGLRPRRGAMQPPRTWGRLFEAALLFAVLTAVSLAVVRTELPLLFLVFPFLGWAAWRFGQRGAAPAALLVSGVAVWAAAKGWGPFAPSHLLDNMVTLQAFDATVALTSFVGAAAVSERTRARQALEEVAQRLEHEAVHDALTGLPNRKLVLDRLEQALARSRRAGGLTAVMFLDLDRFKVINDSLGHAEGDKVLLAAAGRLANAMRPSDTVGRFGGDEFIVICEQLESERDAVQIAERLAETISRPISLDSGDAVLTASLGIALADAPTARPQALVRDADAAMYRAKERGGACYEIFDQAMRQRAVRRMQLEKELRAAIERGELRLFFQPQRRLADSRIVGVEALVRWQHPIRGLLRPAEFIGMAEETGLILPVGHWVLEEACRHLNGQAATSHAQESGVTVAVNVSARELARPDYAELVKGVLDISGTSPSRIHLEITENVLVEATESVLSQLEALRAMGLKVAIDDFGTGYSSLSYLKRFPVDTIKIDRSFVDDICDEPGDGAIAEALINLAHCLGLSCVAEGVETELQLGRLRELGCELAQGYFLGEPQSADSFHTILR